MKKTARKIATLVGTMGLAFGLSANVSAAFINGSVSFSDGLDSVSNIVNDLTFFDIGTPTIASGATLDLAAISGVTMAKDIDLTDPTGNNPVYVNAGFTFVLDSISNVVSSGLSCNAGLCTDDIGFSMTGIVNGPGFDPTAWSGTFTANGSCIDAGGGVCVEDSESGSWSSSIVALGREVPVPAPATLALLGGGLLGLALARRRRTSIS